MIELAIISKDAKHTAQLLENAGFNLDRPIKSFQSKNIDGMLHQQLDDGEFLTLLLDSIKDLEERVLSLERGVS